MRDNDKSLRSIMKSIRNLMTTNTNRPSNTKFTKIPQVMQSNHLPNDWETTDLSRTKPEKPDFGVLHKSEWFTHKHKTMKTQRVIIKFSQIMILHNGLNREQSS